MKTKHIKYLCALFIWVLGTSIHGQEITNLNPVDEFTYTKHSAKVSFTENTNSENNKTLGTNQTNLSTKSSSREAGITPGVFDVSLTGAATYTIPIKLPPGIAGVQPEISIAYNSQSGEGTISNGWNIGGLSSITRIPSTKYHDGVIDPVDFDNLDRFALDGQRLVLKSGTYGANGAEYQTENYSNLKITSHGTSSYGATYGPSYFLIKYPDGSKAYYGNTSTSRSRLEYALTTWENPQGIRITYQYTTLDNILQISKILYGSKGSTTAVNEVRFIYSDKAVSQTTAVVNTGFTRKKIPTEIQIYGNGTRYKNYVLTYRTEINWGVNKSIQNLNKITEFTGDKSKSLQQIIFSYGADEGETTHALTTSDLGVVNIEQRNSKVVSLDLTGNSKMDFLVYPNTRDKFYLFKDQNYRRSYTINTGGKFENIFPTTWLNHQNKILKGQGLTVVQNANNNTVKFKVYSNGISGNPVDLQYEKTWSAPTYTEMFSCNFGSTTKRIPQQYISGDFNGDGLTDIIAIGRSYSSRTCRTITPPPGQSCGGPDQIAVSDNLNTNSNDQQNIIFDGCCECNTNNNNISKVTFINLDRRMSSGFATNSGRLRPLGSEDRIFGIDVNGDGKTDIMHVSNGRVDVYSINKNNQLVLLWTTTNSYIKNDFPILIGDYNGDGKTDFMTPHANNSYKFQYFTSTGTKFISQSSTFSFNFKNSYFSEANGKWSGFNLYPVDINKDGKTDIVQYDTETWNHTSNGTQKFNIYHNLGRQGSSSSITFQAKNADSKVITGNLNHFPVPVFLSSQQPNDNLEFAIISNQWIHSFTSTTDFKKLGLLKSVSNNGVFFQINYSTLNDTGDGSTYKEGNSQIYPYVDIHNSRGIDIVSSVERKISGVPTIRQEFYYKGAVSHLEGLGFQGFRYISRSNWHTGATDRIFNNSTHDISLRGAITSQFQTPYTQRFGTIPSDYIAKTTNTFEQSLASNKVFKLQNTQSTSQNQLDGTVTTSHFVYDSYNNPTSITINYSGHGSTVTTNTYSNSTGNDYYIGRPTMKKVTSNIGTQSFSTEERYTYSGYLISSIKTKGNDTQFDTESYTHDAFGNITKITSTPYGETSRVTSYKYDASGRFIIQSTDIEGLITSYQYNTKTGVMLNTTNPYGQKTTYEYDLWHRPIKVTDFLGNSTTTTFSKSNSWITTTTITNDDGSSTESITDPLNRLISEGRKTMSGNMSKISYQYDELGRVSGRSEPHFGDAPSQWNTIEYDFYGRVARENLFTGKTISYTYNGLATTVNDGTKTVTTTTDALGNVTRLDDPGGTIRYTYFGNGNMKSSAYEGATQVIEQDGWGRKTKLTDPSAGVYTYSYNGFNDIIEQTSPKGTTTNTYSTTGQMLSSHVKGDLTDMKTVYTYDNTTKLLNRIDGTDAINKKSYSYIYSYDQYLRPQQISENNGEASFSLTYEYDQYSRIRKERQTADINRRSSSNEMVYNYDTHGAFIGFDQWKIIATNARNQITDIELGTGDLETMEYDTYGYLKKNAVYNADLGTNYIENTYKFNASRGTLTSRTHKTAVTGYSASFAESFQYDIQDRLTSISGPFAKTNTYDGSGRITKNSDIGDLAYLGSSKRYQLKNISLNTKGEQYYQNRARQEISYNAFKKPVDIYENGKGRVSFEYGPMGNRVRAWYGGLDNKKEDRTYRKQYASIISAEIIQNTNDNSYKFIFYKGGDAYSAPMARVHKMNNQGDDVSDYYLQRDHQGSILNITREIKVGNQIKGEVVERRQFGAWGTVDAFWSKDTGTTMGHNSILDRGYTGHEHFFEVGLIHMNGRMYDPKMQRFLSPDNYIQDPYNTQNYNRYSYVLNNPLMYTDPTGEMADCGCGGFGWFYNGSNNSLSENFRSIGATFEGLADTFSNVGDWFSSKKTNLESIRDWIGGFFEKRTREARNIEIANSSVSSDPLVYTSSIVPPTFTTTGGANIYRNNTLANRNHNPKLVTVKTEEEWNNDSINWALGLSGALLADDATVIGVADDVLIPVVLLAGTGAYLYDNSELIAQQLREINRILEKNLGGRGFTYELRATRSGQYPIMAKGSSVPVGYTHLNVGDVWKYGETTQGFDRYPSSFLKSNGLIMDPIFFGTIPEIKAQEKIMLFWYAITHGELPPGNKIFR